MPPKPHAFNSKKAKLYNSRAIRSQLAEPNFKDGILSVPQFLASREFEIKAFELSQLNTKYASATRVFQSLPRSLRRRAASHNVKRIPKRLRNRAVREMQNSINGVPPKKPQLRGRELYRLKMTKRLLKMASRIKAMKSVPTSEVHGKLNLRSKLKLLNGQIKDLNSQQKEDQHKPTNIPFVKLNNTVGAYDNTGIDELALKPRGNVKYSHRQKEFVWLPTHVWHAKRFHMIKKWGYQIPYKPTQKCFKATNRASRQGAILYEGSYNGTLIIEVNSGKDASKSDQAFLNILKEVSKYKNVDFPQHYLNGARARTYDDWIYVNGAKAGKGLIYANKDQRKILIRVNPSLYETLFEFCLGLIKDQEGSHVYDCRYSMGSLELHGPSSLNALSKILHISQANSSKDAWISFANHRDSSVIPKGTTFSFNVRDPRNWKHPVNPPPCTSHTPHTNDELFKLVMDNPPSINASSVSDLLDSHQRSESYREFKTNKQLGKEFSLTKPTANRVQNIDGTDIPLLITKLSNGNWVLMLPWYWVLPMWLKLLDVRGVTVAGSRQLHQVNFENGLASFPTDYPFLPQGWVENYLVGALNKSQYVKLAKSKRPYPEFEHGYLRTLSCDWYFLSKLRYCLVSMPHLLQTVSNPVSYASFDEASNRRECKHITDAFKLIHDARLESPRTEADEKCVELYSKSNHNHQHLLSGEFTADLTKSKFPPLPVIQVKLVLQNKGLVKDNARIYKVFETSDNDTSSTKHAIELSNLMGFVTTGTYNLNMGKSTGIGVMSAEAKKEQQVLVRNVGCTQYYHAKWEKI